MFRVPLERQGKRCAMCGHVYETSCACIKTTKSKELPNMNTKFDWTRINNDVNGNPRYVLHFLNLNTQEEKDASGENWIPNKYELALNRARKIGGKKFNNKQYGGGIVFQSYNLRDTEFHIERVLQEG